MNQSRNLVFGVSALVAAVVVAYFVYDYRKTGRPCESIFEQTATRFDLKLKAMAAEGEILLGREKLQDLTENAQLTALNLKTCCIALDTGGVNADQFLKCKTAGQDYEEKLQEVVQQISRAQEAQRRDDAAALAELRQRLAATVADAKSISSQLQADVAEIGSPTREEVAAAADGERPVEPAPPSARSETDGEGQSGAGDGTPPPGTGAEKRPDVVTGAPASDPGSAIQRKASVLPTLVVAPLTRFTEPPIEEILVVSAGTDLGSFRPVQRVKKFSAPMVVEPGVYDIVLDAQGQSMVRLVAGLEVASSQEVTVDPNAFVSFVLVEPLARDGFPPLKQVFALKAGTDTSGYVRFRHSTNEIGSPMLVEPGTFDLYAVPVGGSFVNIARGVAIGVGEGLRVDPGPELAVIRYDDPQVPGFELERVYVVAAGTDLQSRHQVLQEARRFGEPLLVEAGGSYDIVLQPKGGSPVKVQQNVTPAPGEILRFGAAP